MNSINPSNFSIQYQGIPSCDVPPSLTWAYIQEQIYEDSGIYYDLKIEIKIDENNNNFLVMCEDQDEGKYYLITGMLNGDEVIWQETITGENFTERYPGDFRDISYFILFSTEDFSARTLNRYLRTMNETELSVDNSRRCRLEIGDDIRFPSNVVQFLDPEFAGTDEAENAGLIRATHTGNGEWTIQVSYNNGLTFTDFPL